MSVQLLTADDLADRWQVPKRHIYALSRRGEIPTVQLGRYYRYRLDQVEAFELGADTVNTDKLAGATAATAPRP